MDRGTHRQSAEFNDGILQQGGGRSERRNSRGSKRNRSPNDLPGSPDENQQTDASHNIAHTADEGRGEPSRYLVVKRACNECRQHKIKCDVVQEPFTPCTRCRRISLECRIDANFKRVEKRRDGAKQRYQERPAQLQSVEILAIPPTAVPLVFPEDLVARASPELSYGTTSTLPTEPENPVDLGPTRSSSRPLHADTPPTWPEFSTHEISNPVLDQNQNSGQVHLNTSSPAAGIARKLGGAELTAGVVQQLFHDFFTHYHPFLPLLDPQKSPDQYYRSSRLLFWAIVSVASRRFVSDLSLLSSLSISVPRLLWSTIQSVSQNYHDVKALCLMCTWSFPTSSSSLDPTFLLCGTMMHLAMQVGLHKPSHAQDFSKFKVELRDEELKDRMVTWAVCNIVAQSVATGYGQPPITMYDWTLESVPSKESFYTLPLNIAARLRIEKFSDRVTKMLYNNAFDSIGIGSENERFGIVNILNRELRELESDIGTDSVLTTLHFRCAQLHLRLCAFFDSSTAKDYTKSLLSLYESCRILLELVHSSSLFNGDILNYSTTYIFQMILASGFAMLRLLQSPLADFIDMEEGKRLFNSAIVAARRISVSNNDLPGRLAEVLVQLRASGSLLTRTPPSTSSGLREDLKLKICCRMSMSVVFDSLWRWRDEFQAKSKRHNNEPNIFDLETPQEQAEIAISPPVNETEMQTLASGGSVGGNVASLAQEINFDESSFDAFYPLNWIIDGIVDVSNPSVGVQNFTEQ